MIYWMRRHAGGVALTTVLAVCALLLGHNLWKYYVDAPWTRDGRVTADVVRIAPEISGTISAVHVIENQFVHEGDVLFQISPERFQLAVEAAQADLDSALEAMKLDISTAERNTKLEQKGSLSAEAAERSQREAAAARAEARSAEVALDVAKLNLKRTAVRAPVDGYVTNLHLRKGDYAVTGDATVTLVDAGSFRVTGYFRETQLARIKPGDPVRIGLMGVSGELQGHVESFGRGIANSNAASDDLGLPLVEPVFSWVRLAQRIPVRIAIDGVPSGVELAAGMTASVSVVTR
ncbi:HlyD family secretion protein [Rhodovulum sulfidophilum]|uniref:efflux RND transporter periplasmic adaptor subunit n=1 Tax=Rhodovulum sulfidophilum TaxID=35806 RepID=UPI0019224AC7|nr:HlyD family secretion protein [Rhodovulum sulfidophilum]MBL3573500.1 HlyD family secretion protein [Rhodovulum sulfidophilum]MCE8432579.1 HlyD family secretion protein [Rhodovulum sulfidophilum]MCF4118781.1 HlyD family secretion protein [Rhodovulum sulfidophilum]